MLSYWTECPVQFFFLVLMTQTDRQAGWQAGRQIDRQTDRPDIVLICQQKQHLQLIVCVCGGGCVGCAGNGRAFMQQALMYRWVWWPANLCTFRLLTPTPLPVSFALISTNAWPGVGNFPVHTRFHPTDIATTNFISGNPRSSLAQLSALTTLPMLIQHGMVTSAEVSLYKEVLI